MTILSLSIREYFDKYEFNKYNHLNIAFPVSVRFKIPKTPEEIEPELYNVFSPAKISLPIVKTYEEGIEKISKLMN